MKNRQTTNNKSRMIIRKTTSMLLACLASTYLFSSQAIAGTLSASVAATPATIDLTAAGTLDWARWGGGNYTADDPAAYNHKASVTPLISTYTLVGPDAATSAEQWNDAGTPLFTWSDGTPALTGDGLGNGGSFFPNTGNSINGVGDGYQITVPASTTPQILKVFTGCYSALVNFNAALSDNSAPPYNDQSLDAQTGNGFNGVYTILFAAGSAGQTLTVTITMTNVYAFDTNYANVTLEAAVLTGPSPIIVTPPASSTNWVGLNQQFSVAVDGGQPFSYQWWKESGGVYVPLADAGQISGSTSNTLTINNLVFANATNYFVVVTNVYGAVTSSVASLAIFPITGTLIGASPAATAMVDLTALGTLDWAAWGFNVATDFDQKAGGTNQISNFTLIGPGPNGPYRYNNALAAFSWSDGSPDPTAAATTTGVYFNGLNNGYQITVPADQTNATGGQGVIDPLVHLVQEGEGGVNSGPIAGHPVGAGGVGSGRRITGVHPGAEVVAEFVIRKNPGAPLRQARLHVGRSGRGAVIEQGAAGFDAGHEFGQDIDAKIPEKVLGRGVGRRLVRQGDEVVVIITDARGRVVQGQHRRDPGRVLQRLLALVDSPHPRIYRAGLRDGNPIVQVEVNVADINIKDQPGTRGDEKLVQIGISQISRIARPQRKIQAVFEGDRPVHVRIHLGLENHIVLRVLSGQAGVIIVFQIGPGGKTPGGRTPQQVVIANGTIGGLLGRGGGGTRRGHALRLLAANVSPGQKQQGTARQQRRPTTMRP